MMTGINKVIVLLFLLLISVLSFLVMHHEKDLGWQILQFPFLTLGLKVLSVAILSIHVIKNPELDAFYKVNWIYGSLALGLVLIPVYWYKYIWRGSLNPHKLSISSRGQQVEVN